MFTCDMTDAQIHVPENVLPRKVWYLSHTILESTVTLLLLSRLWKFENVRNGSRSMGKAIGAF